MVIKLEVREGIESIEGIGSIEGLSGEVKQQQGGEVARNKHQVTNKIQVTNSKGQTIVVFSTETKGNGEIAFGRVMKGIPPLRSE